MYSKTPHGSYGSSNLSPVDKFGYLKVLLLMIFISLPFGILKAGPSNKEISFSQLPAPSGLSALSVLSATPDTILYDNNTALYLDTTSSDWTGVKFTPISHHFELQAIYFAILNQYGNTTNGCSLYVVQDDGSGEPDWPSGVLAGLWVAPPLPNMVWVQVDLTSSINFSANEDFHIIYGPAPAGPYPGTGWWNLFDSDSSTTQRTHVSWDNRQSWLTSMNADAFIRAGGTYFTTPLDFSVSAFAGSYAPWGTSRVLAIDSVGSVAFWQSELGSPDVDSIFALLSPSEMQTIYDTVMAVGFFSLDTLYALGAADGSGILLWITASGTEHSVEAINLAIPQVNRIVLTLNTILQPYGIQLYYGSLGGRKEGQ
jgi:hypothetical protein